MQLHELKSPKGSRKKKRIIGRGKGSGRGKTSGRGENGARSRTGRWNLASSEGGQMPLIRRLPKVGFRSKRPILNQVVSLDGLNKFDNDAVVDIVSLKALGLINSIHKPVKILGNGEIEKS
ncbi:MAG: 50S ribosomal protein L15, partial [Candidatus Omnitrophica bacterium]|nr:50S ribosomal protein L15 [Candidatus Omnitrophota bacterium]